MPRPPRHITLSRCNAFINPGPGTQSTSGSIDGILSGIRVAVKDNIMVKGFPMNCGSRILNGHVPHEDATCIKLLKAAGVKIIGKTAMDEFGMGSNNIHGSHGPVFNPRFIARPDGPFSAGGSSGGSAAAVASGECQLGIGSDTGGSVRLPASYCGIYGFKPSYGRISRHGLVSYASSLDTIGLLADSISTLRIAFDVMKADSSGDMQAKVRTRPYAPFKPFSKIVIGIPNEMIQPLNNNATYLFNSTLRKLQDRGATIRPISLPSLKDSLDVYYIISMVEAASCLSRYSGQHFGYVPGIIPSKHLNWSERRQLVRELGFGEEVKTRIAIGSELAQSSQYNEALEHRELIKSEFQSAFQQVDFMLTPTAASGPPRLTDVLKYRDREEISSDIPTVPASLAGLPAISVPSEDISSPEACIGMQWIAPKDQDEELLDFISKL